MARFGFGRSSSSSSRASSRSSSSDGSGLRQSGSDALQLVIDYVKQETLTPLKGLGRYLLFGIAGSILLCGGLVLLLVSVLRLLQEETGTFFAGNMSWAPYLIVAGVAVVLIALAAWRIVRGPAARRRPRPET